MLQQKQCLFIGERYWSNVVGISGDNCTVNVAIAARTGKFFVGCYLHRLILAVNVFLEEYKPLLEKVDNLMVKLLTKVNSGALRAAGCFLKPIRLMRIRLAGYFLLMDRYFAISNYLNVGILSQNVTILELLPTALEHNNLTRIFSDLKVFQSISKGLQKTDTTMLKAHTAFNPSQQDPSQS